MCAFDKLLPQTQIGSGASLLQTLRNVLRNVLLFLAPFIFLSTLTSLPVLAKEKHSHGMILSPLWYPQGDVES